LTWSQKAAAIHGGFFTSEMRLWRVKKAREIAAGKSILANYTPGGVLQ
jgi:hypothetical protein